MDDTKQSDEEQQKNEPKKPVGEQITDLVAAAAGALAENTVKSVAKRVRKAAVKKTGGPMKKAVRAVGKTAKAPKKPRKKVAKNAVTRAKKPKKPSKKSAPKKKAGKKKSKSRR